LDDGRFALEFRVHDTGIGLSAAQIDTLFQPFSQADASNTRRHGGTGLGLAIAKQLVELMRGEIWVESTVGQGSMFAFTAWFTAASLETPEEPAGNTVDVAAARSRLAGTRILVAEDNPFNQVVIKKLLTKVGASVTLCANGLLALDALEHEAPFDLVLMDVQMPEMDGYAATRVIRATPALTGTRVIAMTANAMAEDRRLCIEAGMNDFEPKPIDPDHMYVTLAKWLPAHSANG
jgi:CheY-like chemotaxis protein